MTYFGKVYVGPGRVSPGRWDDPAAVRKASEWANAERKKEFAEMKRRGAELIAETQRNHFPAAALATLMRDSLEIDGAALATLLKDLVARAD